jgi:hypothetical protein
MGYILWTGVSLLFLLLFGTIATILYYWLWKVKETDFPSDRISNIYDFKWKTGDLLLFSSESDWFNRVFGKCVWTHIEIVYCDPETHFVYTWGTRDAKLQPKLELLIPRIERYPGGVCVRPLLSGSMDLSERFLKCIQKTWNTGYDFQVALIAFSRFFEYLPVPQLPILTAQNYKTCSSLSAQLYVDLGILPKDWPATKTLPCDFASNATKKTPQSEQDQQMAERFGPEIFLRSDYKKLSKKFHSL